MDKNSELSKSVIQRELQWAKAHLYLDLELMDEILSEGYQKIRSNGSVTGKKLFWNLIKPESDTGKSQKVMITKCMFLTSW